MPVVIILVLVVLAFGSGLAGGTGTLVFMAASSSRYSSSVELHATFTIGSSTETSPVNLTLSQGTYTISFGPLNWYITPASRTVTLARGSTEYVYTTYDPILRKISVSQGGFNVTSVTALHGVTPVVWTNDGDSAVTLHVDSIGTVIIDPSRNYTAVFATGGTFQYDIPRTNFSGSVKAE